MPKVREAVLFAHGCGLINDEEFALLYDVNKPKNPDMRYSNYEQFDINKLSDDECRSNFRFFRNDIYTLKEVMQLPEQFTCYNGVKVDCVEALSMYLKRFAYPCRYADLVSTFARPIPQLCMITNEVMNFVYLRWRHLLSDLNQPWLSPERLQLFADAIHNKGAALNNCWGFIDGTVRPVSRPGKNQRVLYNGHKKVHAIKFQSIAAPNGLIANLFGPVEGKRHDSAMLAMSGILDQMQQYSVNPDGDFLCVYGDPAYPLRPQLQAPFRGGILTEDQRAWNKSMSTVRVAVEWLFGDIINYFKFLDFRKNLKVFLSAVGKMYLSCALVQNAHTCLYGSTTSKYFQLDPPTLEEYFVL